MLLYMAQYGVVVFIFGLGHLNFLSEVVLIVLITTSPPPLDISILIFPDAFTEVLIHTRKHFNNLQSIQ